MDTLKIPFKKLHELAQCPAYAYAGDAGCDLHSVEELTLKPFQRAMLATGIAIALPQGYAGFVLPRSGLAAKHGISVVNAPGLIDSNYRGELKVILLNTDPYHEFKICVGDRIAQLVIMQVAQAQFQQTEKLDDTCRGAGGFGSSGIAQ